jgi:DHA3 family macrolide efflux protein-like MFS transporter
MALMQAVVEPDKQGRVFTLLGSMSAGMAPLGLIIAGPVSDAIGVRAWFVMAGVGLVLVGAGGFLSPTLLSIENGPPAVAPAEPAQLQPEPLPAPAATRTASAG